MQPNSHAAEHLVYRCANATCRNGGARGICPHAADHEPDEWCGEKFVTDCPKCELTQEAS